MVSYPFNFKLQCKKLLQNPTILLYYLIVFKWIHHPMLLNPPQSGWSLDSHGNAANRLATPHAIQWGQNEKFPKQPPGRRLWCNRSLIENPLLQGLGRPQVMNHWSKIHKTYCRCATFDDDLIALLANWLLIRQLSPPSVVSNTGPHTPDTPAAGETLGCKISLKCLMFIRSVWNIFWEVKVSRVHETSNRIAVFWGLLRIVDHKLPEGVGLLSPAMTNPQKKTFISLRTTGEIPGKQLKLEKQLDLWDLGNKMFWGVSSMDLFGVCLSIFRFFFHSMPTQKIPSHQPSRPVADGAVEFPRFDLVTWKWREVEMDRPVRTSLYNSDMHSYIMWCNCIVCIFSYFTDAFQINSMYKN